MSKLPLETRKRLREEARDWDAAIQAEPPDDVQKLLAEAELFEAHRPVRRAVSLRLDPSDIAMLKRLARRKGIPYTQLIALWLHERIEQEQSAVRS
jgi:predicted DNA binding CopG/RHH family protein